jgi:hypothetical protein
VRSWLAWKHWGTDVATWAVTLDFGDTTGPRDITDCVNLETFRRTRQLHNDLHAVSWNLSFGLVRNPTITTLLLGNEGDVEIAVTKDGDAYFTGQLTTDYVVAIRTRLQEIPIKAVDNGERLRRVIKGDGVGGDVKWAGYAVCDPGDSAASLVHQLLTLAGFTASEWDLGAGDTIADTIDYFVSLLGDKITYYDQLDQLLYEFGYVFVFGADGKFRIADAYPADTSSSEMFDSGNLIGELAIGRKKDRYEAAEVTYTPHYTNTNVVLFRDTTGGAESLECNIPVLAGEFYPVGAGDGDVYCEYRGEELSQAPASIRPVVPGVVYGRPRQRTDIVQGDLICANNVALSVVMDANLVTNTFTDRYKRAKLEIENTGGTTQYITRLNIVGDATVAANPAIVESNNHVNTDRIMAYKSAYLTTKTQATRLSEGLEDYYRYSCLQYQFLSRTAADMGDIVTVEDDVLGSSNIVRIVRAVDNEKYGMTQYTGEGLEAYVAGVVTQHSVLYATAKALVAHELTVASSEYSGIADLRCDGDTDEAQIQTAIDHLSTYYGGGAVRLTEGTYYIDTAAIAMKSNVMLVGRGAGATVVKKNLNDYAIEAVGTSGAHLTNVAIRDLTVTRDAGDTNAVESVFAHYVDRLQISGVKFLANYWTSLFVQQCNDPLVTGCSFEDGSAYDLSLSSSPGGRVEASAFRDSYDAVLLDSASEGSMSVVGCTFQDVENSAIKIASGGGDVVSGNRIEDCAQRVPGLSAIDVDGGTAETISDNSCRNNGQLMERGNCESATDPAITGQAGNTETNCTFARSADFAHNGTYSFKLTDGGNSNFMYFHDALSTADVVGLVVGCSYTLSAWVYVPAGQCLGTEVILGIGDYVPAAWVDTEQAAANTYDAWQLVTVTRTLRSTATGVRVYLRTLDAATTGEFCYVDDIRLRPDGTHNEHSQNFSDAGTGTRQDSNSWNRPYQA